MTLQEIIFDMMRRWHGHVTFSLLAAPTEILHVEVRSHARGVISKMIPVSQIEQANCDVLAIELEELIKA